MAGCALHCKSLEAPMRPTLHACTRTALACTTHAPPCLHMPTHLPVTPLPPSHPPTPLLSPQAPMLLELGVHPATAAASSQAAMLISACTSSVVYLVNDAVPQVLAWCFLGAGGSGFWVVYPVNHVVSQSPVGNPCR